MHGCMGCIFASGANLWGMWELVHLEQGGIQLITCNLLMEGFARIVFNQSIIIDA
jgi:hypothetical protein